MIVIPMLDLLLFTCARAENTRKNGRNIKRVHKCKFLMIGASVDIIKSGGYKISSLEIEAVLLQVGYFFFREAAQAVVT